MGITDHNTVRLFQAITRSNIGIIAQHTKRVIECGYLHCVWTVTITHIYDHL